MPFPLKDLRHRKPGWQIFTEARRRTAREKKSPAQFKGEARVLKVIAAEQLVPSRQSLEEFHRSREVNPVADPNAVMAN